VGMGDMGGGGGGADICVACCICWAKPGGTLDELVNTYVGCGGCWFLWIGYALAGIAAHPAGQTLGKS
jgi:hypothetical protein